jgi:hypothetical protein
MHSAIGNCTIYHTNLVAEHGLRRGLSMALSLEEAANLLWMIAESKPGKVRMIHITTLFTSSFLYVVIADLKIMQKQNHPRH